MKLCQMQLYSVGLCGKDHAYVKFERLRAMGCSCVVYDAELAGQSCIVKEHFPEGLAEQGTIYRRKNGAICLRKPPVGWIAWHLTRLRYIRAVMLAQRLQHLPVLSHSIVPLRGLYRANNTLYTVTETEGRDSLAWNLIDTESVDRIIDICIQIANMTEQIHKLGWLMIDIKASNYVVADAPSGAVMVRMIDFDSMVQRKHAPLIRRFFCSSETAPPEMIKGNGWDVSTHSDVYSIAAMLFRKLTKQPVMQDLRRTFDERALPLMVDWPPSKITRLMETLEFALMQNPHIRMSSCCELASRLKGCKSYEDL